MSKRVNNHKGGVPESGVPFWVRLRYRALRDARTKAKRAEMQRRKAVAQYGNVAR